MHAMYFRKFRPLAMSLMLSTLVLRAQEPAAPPVPRAAPVFNPDISAILDVYLHADDAHRGGIRHVFEGLAGFGHLNGGGAHDHAHDYGGLANGFNLRHVELAFSAAVDPYFKAAAIAAVDPDDAKLEVAEIETTSLPSGFALKLGKFYSAFGRLNAQHSHAWDFVDRPLVLELLLGDHGLNDTGAQLTWLAPTPFYLLLGAEAFQGNNEKSFAYHGDAPLPERDGPRVGVGWAKIGPVLPGDHALQVGASMLFGRHQEEHAEDGSGGHDHYAFDGDTRCWGLDAVYKYNAPHPLGEGDVVVQAEYFARRKQLDLLAYDLPPALVGRQRVDEQDGYYVQATYGLLPRWRVGLRWEQIGLTNETERPSGARERFDASERLAMMLDFTPSEYSRLRAQINHGRYATAEGREDVIQGFVQWKVSLGTHGAHRF